jgi:hypothetical protein
MDKKEDIMTASGVWIASTTGSEYVPNVWYVPR